MSSKVMIPADESPPWSQHDGEVERRRTRRLELCVPVRTTNPASGTVIGFTENVSLSGAYFYVDNYACRPGGSIEYVLQLPAGLTLSEAVWVLCFGTLTRVENVAGKSGIAVKLDAVEVLNSPTRF